MDKVGPLFVICLLLLGLVAFFFTRSRGMRGLSTFFLVAVILGAIAFVLGHYMKMDLTRLPEKILDAIGL